MSYSIRFSREAESDIDAVNQSDRKLFARIIKKIEFLEKSYVQKDCRAECEGL